MLGAETVPHWLRRAISYLNSETQIPQLRGIGGVSQAKKAVAQRRLLARQRVARESTLGRRRGPKVLEEIVMSWEEQDARKARSTTTQRKRLIRS